MLIMKCYIIILSDFYNNNIMSISCQLKVFFLLTVVFYTTLTDKNLGSSSCPSNRTSQNCYFEYQTCSKQGNISFQFSRCILLPQYKEIRSSNQCVQYCCQDKTLIIQSQSDIQKCLQIQRKDQSWFKFLYIGIGIGFFLMLVSCTIIFICWFKISNQHCSIHQQLSQDLQLKNNITKKISIQMNQSFTDFNFSKRQEKQIEDDICSICLDGCIQCTLSCNHKFHLKCILQWAIRKSVCPLCQSKSLKQIKYLCKTCNKMIKTFNYSKKIEKQEYNRIAKAVTKLKCLNCNNKNS